MEIQISKMNTIEVNMGIIKKVIIDVIKIGMEIIPIGHHIEIDIRMVVTIRSEIDLEIKEFLQKTEIKISKGNTHKIDQ